MSKIHEGKAKTIFSTAEEGVVLQYFKDDVTAFNRVKHDKYANKGIMCNIFSAFLMSTIKEFGFENHFISVEDERTQKIIKVDIVPIEFIVRNIVAGSLVKRLGMVKGKRLQSPIVEFYYKNDDLGDPLMTSEHITEMGLLTIEEIDYIRGLLIRLNDFLCGFFIAFGIVLVDFKLEIGRLGGKFMIADEISPDTCRFWDVNGNNFDKDVYRDGTGDLLQTYGALLKKFDLENKGFAKFMHHLVL